MRHAAHPLVLPVFSFTLFLSAAAMFALQPMAGKMLLPLVGGTPAGWVVAMAFFQSMLLAGYLVAHLLSGFGARTHAALYLLGLSAGLYFLPIHLSAHAEMIHDSPGPLDVFSILTLTLAVPFIALSATSSTIQRLFITTGHETSANPYFLYAASNLGSVMGLLAYPLLIEPHLTLSAQTWGWAYAYLLLIACAGGCLALSKRGTADIQKEKITITTGRRLEWLALAFFPSSLLLGVTTYITTDVISMPLIWVVPLAIYLLAFVAAFARRPPVSLKVVEIATPFAIVGMVSALALRQFAPGLGLGIAAVHLVGFGICALYCALRLSTARPPAERLTDFYLLLALGGALGGIFNAFIAPHIFTSIVEYPLALLALSLLLPGFGARTGGGKFLIVLLCAVAAVANTPLLLISIERMKDVTNLCSLLFVLAILALIGGRRSYMFPMLTCIYIALSFITTNRDIVFMSRNFFGAMKVFDQPAPKGINGKMRLFTHGTTLHGFQLLDQPTLPTAYYTNKGHFRDVFKAFNPHRVAVIGLGIGTINCITAPGRRFTFIDIDPGVVEIAENQYTFLKACKPHPRIIIGDGRLEMERLKGETFDLLTIDAFSSDSIPAHLLTAEALKSYFERLSPKGVLVVHISNRHFKLHTPIAMTTDSLGLQSKYGLSMDLDKLEPYASKSVWVIVGRKSVDLDGFAKQYGWQDIPRDPTLKPWTDDYTNLLASLKMWGK
jgi:hypothetical protein